jgi:hypothetical protein
VPAFSNRQIHYIFTPPSAPVHYLGRAILSSLTRSISGRPVEFDQLKVSLDEALTDSKGLIDTKN